MPSRNQKRSGTILRGGSDLAGAAPRCSFFEIMESGSAAYRSRRNRSVSGKKWRSKSTLSYPPNGPTMRQRVSSPLECAAVSKSMLAPSDAAATSASRRLKVQPLWIVAADFTRRRIALKAQLFAAC